jgi:DNA-binding transcriptional MerR regulator
MPTSAAIDKSPEAYRTISEVAEAIDLPQHVLRFWETRFPQIKPLKRGGGRRYYRPDDVKLLEAIKRLLYDRGYTIKGVQRMLREQGALAVIETDGAAPAETELEPVREAPAPSRREPPMSAPALSPRDVAALSAALAEIREAERQLRQARAH